MSTIIISLVVAALFALAIWRIYKAKKNHKCNCGMNCGGCSGQDCPPDCVGNPEDKK